MLVYVGQVNGTDCFRTATTLQKYRAGAIICQKKNKQSSGEKMKNFMFQPAKRIQEVSMHWKFILIFSGAGQTPCVTHYLQRLRSPEPSGYTPWCNPGGSYRWQQCHSTYCFCVNKDGEELRATRVDNEAGRPKCTEIGEVLYFLCFIYAMTNSLWKISFFLQDFENIQ